MGRLIFWRLVLSNFLFCVPRIVKQAPDMFDFGEGLFHNGKLSLAWGSHIRFAELYWQAQHGDVTLMKRATWLLFFRVNHACILQRTKAGPQYILEASVERIGNVTIQSGACGVGVLGMWSHDCLNVRIGLVATIWYWTSALWAAVTKDFMPCISISIT